MEAEDLIARENEFKRLNKQLEKKTESLMKEIESAMQKQDIFSEFSCNLTLSPVHRSTKKHCCETPNSTPKKEVEKPGNQKKIRQKTKNDVDNNTSNINTDDESTFENNKQDNIDNKDSNIMKKNVCDCCIFSGDKKNNDLEFLYAFVSVNVKDNVLPPAFSKDKITVESVCKYLSAKVKLMQEQIDKLQSTIDKKAKQCEGHMTQLAEMEGERLTLLNRTNSMRSETADVKAKYAATQNRLNEKDRLYKEQRSSADKLTSELKRLRSKNANLEARCASQEETMTTLKQQLDTAKMVEKEFRDSTRNLSASHQNAICRLEAKTKTLSATIDKQNQLIDNLRKQIALLQTEDALRAFEKDYTEFLKQDL